MDNPVEQIKAKVDITEFIGSRIELKKSGRNYKALCPFHNEKTPSFMVSPERQIWHCFGACKEGGDIFKFVMKYEGLTFYESLQELAKLTGVTLKRLDFADRVWQKKQRLLEINSMAGQLFHYLLANHKVGQKTLEYLKKRGVSERIIKSFKLGYAPISWDFTSKYLLKKKISYQELIDAGLSVRTNSNRYLDRFRGRLIFPLTDSRNNIIGFSGRIANDQKDNKKMIGDAKYINTSETFLYKKRESFFGLPKAKDAIIQNKSAVIVEGEFDMLSCFIHGITNTIAIKGSALTTEQLTILKHYCNHLILALDSDIAGDQTTLRAITDAINYDFNIEIVSYDFAKDPDEALLKDPILFKKCLKKPIPIYDYLLDQAVSKHGTKTAFAKKELIDFVVPYFINLQNPIIKDHYLKKLSQIVDVEINVIENVIKKALFLKKRKEKNLSIFKPKEAIDRYEMLQKYVLSVLFQSSQPKNIYEDYFNIITKEDFNVPAYQNLIDHFEKYIRNHDKYQVDKFIKIIPAQLQHVFDELFLFDISFIDKDLIAKNVNRTLYELKKISIKNQIRNITKNKLDNKGQKTINQLTKILNDIEKKLIIV